MEKMEKFLCDTIEHAEHVMSQKPVAKMSHMEKDYIRECCDLALKVMAVLAGKKAYDKHMPMNDGGNPYPTNML